MRGSVVSFVRIFQVIILCLNQLWSPFISMTITEAESDCGHCHRNLCPTATGTSSLTGFWVKWECGGKWEVSGETLWGSQDQGSRGCFTNSTQWSMEKMSKRRGLRNYCTCTHGKSQLREVMGVRCVYEDLKSYWRPLVIYSLPFGSHIDYLEHYGGEWCHLWRSGHCCHDRLQMKSETLLDCHTCFLVFLFSCLMGKCFWGLGHSFLSPSESKRHSLRHALETDVILREGQNSPENRLDMWWWCLWWWAPRDLEIS